MRSGEVILITGIDITFKYGGLGGYGRAQISVDWTGTLYPAYRSMASFLGIFGGNTSPSSTNDRWYGWPLRCLSTAVEGEERWSNDMMCSHSISSWM